jgi:WD40 repeat protein
MIGSEVRPDRQPYAQFSPVGQSLLSAGKDGSANIWDWRPDPRPPADLTSLAELLSGSKLEASGALVPLDPREWRSLCGDRGPTLR